MGFLDDLISGSTDVLESMRALGKAKKSYMVYYKAGGTTLVIAHSKAQARSMVNGKKVKRIVRWH